MEVRKYVRNVERSIAAKDGAALSNLLRGSSPDSVAAATEFLRHPGQNDLRGSLPGEYGTVLEMLLNVKGAVAAKRWYDAFSLHSKAMQAFFKEYDGLSGDNWLCPPVITLCTEHRIIAQEAYEEAIRSKMRVETLSTAEDTIRKFFRKSVQDKTEDLSRSKKRAVLALAVQLFKIHFKLNTLNLCTDVTLLMKAMILDVMDFEEFEMAHKVAYSYYVGRLALYDENFHSAEENLMYAFRRTPEGAPKNKRQIAQFLVCARMNIGVLPTPELLERYRLTRLSDIVAGVRSGDVSRFQVGLEKNHKYLIQMGMYLAMERLQKLVHRSLARKIFLTLRPSKGTRIPLQSFDAATTGLGLDITEDEAECILANLIYEGLMKGYISHQRRMLVLSNQTAFPSVAGVLGA